MPTPPHPTEFPTGDGQPFRPDLTWSMHMGARRIHPSLEAIALPPSSVRWIGNTIPAAARVWQTGYGPRAATPAELAAIPAFLDATAKAHCDADRAMAGFGTGCV